MSEPVVIQHNAAQSAALRIQDAAGALAGCANLIEKLPPPSDPRHVPHAITASLLRDCVNHLAWVHQLLNPSAKGGSGQFLNVVIAPEAAEQVKDLTSGPIERHESELCPACRHRRGEIFQSTDCAKPEPGLCSICRQPFTALELRDGRLYCNACMLNSERVVG